MATNRKLIGFDPENFAARIETKCAASTAKENKLGVEIPSPSRYWSVSTFHDEGTDGEAKALLTLDERSIFCQALPTVMPLASSVACVDRARLVALDSDLSRIQGGSRLP